MQTLSAHLSWSHYGEDIIGKYSKKQMIEVGKKYNKRTLYRIRQFYNIFSNEKVSTLWTQISWSHIRLLFGFEETCINYYIKSIIRDNLSVRELIAKLNNKEYERLSEETKNKLINREESTAIDYVKDPIIKKNNKYVIKYCSDKRIISRTYEFA